MFIVRLWCPDCTDEDMYGCFGGGTDDLDETFPTKEEAEEAGWKAVAGGIWRFDIVEKV